MPVQGKRYNFIKMKIEPVVSIFFLKDQLNLVKILKFDKTDIEESKTNLIKFPSTEFKIYLILDY